MPAVPRSLLLVLGSWACLVGIAHELSLRSSKPWGWRLSAILGSLAWGALVVIVTEGLGLLIALERRPLLIAWAIVLCGSGGLWLWCVLRRTSIRVAAEGLWRRLRGESRQEVFSPVEVAMLCLIALQVGTLAAVAYIYPPNNYDSMNYHLSRVMHWEQQRSVAFFATSTMMEVRGAPFAEYAIAHLQLLVDSDLYANFVQWSAMVLSALGVSCIAGQFGAGRPGQIGAALLAVSIPMGILQATSTQNDYVLASWMVCFAAVAMRLVEEPRSLLWAAATGLALGLAVLSKLTALAYLPPLCVLAGVKLLASTRNRALISGAVIVALAICLNAVFWARMTSTYGSPLGPSIGLSNDLLSLRVAVSNSIRSIAINLPIDVGGAPVYAATRLVMGWLQLAHRFTGLSPVDPRTTLTTAENPFRLEASMHEDLAGNPVHTVLAALTVAACLVAAWRGRSRIAWHQLANPRIGPYAYGICLVAAFVLFNAYFKWQIWHTRLQLPLFVMGVPVIWVILFEARPWVRYVAPIAIAAIGFHWTLGNATRPMSPAVLSGSKSRMELYFANRPDLHAVQVAMLDAVTQAKCRNVGLYIKRDPFEYPIWVMLKERGYAATIEHVHVDSPTQEHARPGFQPCAVISAESIPDRGGMHEQAFGAHFLYLSRSADEAIGEGPAAGADGDSRR